ncbi:conserved Plasmodium protein, unknown function [Plasmodium knowlesi strain H]|uniref:Uncharacterized protein n=3 Tax=Plasmodium knowlesi TaxID=5850 RepID=A0A5K1U471_PLAKH|nr:conserved protein, unknown function [Plasmodium knowlesi strain H]OTN66829.1 Uncharacterized protein PKNOH_S08487100 [Plasmodium knowlesi]CAA9986856.1 conserved protein, unknown function [Plasmodium knowlesi strain H]SBO23702.1 conserved Plasmodium protein, unknown function [Plasmodium knowlesi strain H]SBO25334.1 conserved Plasmodium protein, unknown function [Plasmodium knowlesi strain H]VVS76330.1 conserved protein, unknown function [Plasmodium knowlesi strain H]|eukprot:XP_002260660.1 hypothetical protein, conserved in Plasmodium species [Plasmodium knowlesi strain H]
MGNISSGQTKRPLTLLELSTKIGEYRTINEGDPEMVEDPDFPRKMMNEALSKNITMDGSTVQGTFVYYPNKMKPKMWIGNYNILNPEDILCRNVAEKIGMTETEWKNYVQARKKEQEQPGNVQITPNFDSSPGEQSMSLKEMMKRGTVAPFYSENGEEFPSYSGPPITTDPVISHKKYKGEKYQYFDQQPHSNSCIVKDTGSDEDIYYDMNSTREGEGELLYKVDNVATVEQAHVPNKYKRGEKTGEEKREHERRKYIQKLNNEIKNINAEQERIINEKRKDLFAYSKSNTRQLHPAQNSASFGMKNIRRSTKQDMKNIITELINDNNKTGTSKMHSLKKKKKETYVDLSSMSTKGSLEMKTSSIDKDISFSKRVHTKRTLVK